MRVKFGFNLQAWISGVEVEGNSLKDCREKLLRMTVEEILEEGAVRESDISDIDHVIIEQDFHIKVSKVDYDIDDDEDKEDILRQLPQEFDFICTCAEEDLDDEVCDCITDRTGFLINTCTYEIIEEEK